MRDDRDARRVRKGVAALRDDLAPLIHTAQERFQIPAMSVALVRGSDVLWSEGFGLADVAARPAATAETPHRAGSLARRLTAIAVMQLTENRAIDIDQPLATDLPAFSIRSRFDTAAEPIAVRSALPHQAGLPTDLCANAGSQTRSLAFCTKHKTWPGEGHLTPAQARLGRAKIGPSGMAPVLVADTGYGYPCSPLVQCRVGQPPAHRTLDLFGRLPEKPI